MTTTWNFHPTETTALFQVWLMMKCQCTKTYVLIKHIFRWHISIIDCPKLVDIFVARSKKERKIAEKTNCPIAVTPKLGKKSSINARSRATRANEINETLIASIWFFTNNRWRSIWIGRAGAWRIWWRSSFACLFGVLAWSPKETDELCDTRCGRRSNCSKNTYEKNTSKGSRKP